MRKTVLAFLLLGAAVPVAAQVRLNDPSVVETVRAMQPGQYLWAPEIAPAGPVMIIVSLRDQRAYVYRNGLPIGISTVSTGKEGHVTPTGVFTILQKRVDHKSNLYNNAPMPYMQRLTWDGIALHAGNLPGYPASHGCIRLPRAFAQKLYEITNLGLTVVITDGDAVPRVAPGPGLRQGPVEPAAAAAEIQWHPRRAASGPVAIVISDTDRSIVVLRNGVEIGRAPAHIEGGVGQPAAYALQSVTNGDFRWMKIALPGQEGAGTALSADERARLSMPESFREKLAAILQPGTTVVITRDSLQGSDTGDATTVIAEEEG
ncbi:MAG: L,D-transpeptidase [Novosphingobium sp.]|nr:L,D-transpeptidase [Novosphingobium sp.]